MNSMPIWFENGKVKIIDQTSLPESYVEKEITTVPEMWEAIKGLLVRGAPAIGLAGAFGVYIGVKIWADDQDAQSSDFLDLVNQCVNYLDSARPTAVNLHWALTRMQNTANILYEKMLNDGLNINDLVLGMLYEAEKMLDEDVMACKAIGEFGADLLEKIPNFKAFLTHCNAGALATSRYGTALSPAYILKERGKDIAVYSDETRPLLQGSRLTAWELSRAGIPVTTICDNMAGVVMQKGFVQAVITGADRIAANGDTANKIGTYSVALLAKAHNIPFYIAAPLSTIDLDTKTGDEIPIEQRDAWEVRHFGERQTAPNEAQIFNPAFDVTPHSYITGIITEKGIIYPPYAENVSLLKQGKTLFDSSIVYALQQKVVFYGKKLKTEGLVSASFGNISALDESRRFLAITPSGIYYEDLQPNDICVFDLEKGIFVSENEQRPSSELPMHKAVYEARKDIFAVIHTHSVYATVVASLKQENSLPMIVTELCMAAPDGIVTADFAFPGSDSLAQNAVQALGKNNYVCLLANHGALCCADSLEKALTTAAVLEEGAKVFVIGSQTGKLCSISKKNRKKIFEDMKGYGEVVENSKE